MGPQAIYELHRNAHGVGFGHGSYSMWSCQKSGRRVTQAKIVVAEPDSDDDAFIAKRRRRVIVDD
jgi:hypothetical protein